MKELKEARIMSCLTQQRLGEILGFKGRCAIITVQRWESGERPIPIKYWRQLSGLLGIPLEHFIP